MIVEFNGEQLELFLKKGLYRPTVRSLYVADTHWGKVATFQAYGMSLPNGGLEADLSRLSAMLQQTGAERLVILGDLIHSRHSFSKHVYDTVIAWRQAHLSLHIDLIEGNHDQHIPHLPSALDIQRLPEDTEDHGIWLRHEPGEKGTPPHFCGHIHPGWRIRGRTQRGLTLPCFAISKSQIIFPSFGSFTGCVANLPRRPEQVVLIGENRLFSI